MTENEVIAHWRKRAQESLHLAKRAYEDGLYAHALFNCDHAVERGLKALYMDQKRKEPPITHDLLRIAHELGKAWTPAEREFLTDLTEYAVMTRYDDPEWAEREATKENSQEWIEQTKNFLSTILP